MYKNILLVSIILGFGCGESEKISENEIQGKWGRGNLIIDGRKVDIRDGVTFEIKGENKILYLNGKQIGISQITERVIADNKIIYKYGKEDFENMREDTFTKSNGLITLTWTHGSSCVLVKSND